MTWALLAALILVVLLGRISTRHMTEMEALAGGWPFWLIAAILVAAIATLVRRRT